MRKLLITIVILNPYSGINYDESSTLYIIKETNYKIETIEPEKTKDELVEQKLKEIEQILYYTPFVYSR